MALAQTTLVVPMADLVRPRPDFAFPPAPTCCNGVEMCPYAHHDDDWYLGWYCSICEMATVELQGSETEAIEWPFDPAPVRARDLLAAGFTMLD